MRIVSTCPSQVGPKESASGQRTLCRGISGAIRACRLSILPITLSGAKVVWIWPAKRWMKLFLKLSFSSSLRISSVDQSGLA